jgi:hypothetical protein
VQRLGRALGGDDRVDLRQRDRRDRNRIDAAADRRDGGTGTGENHQPRSELQHGRAGGLAAGFALERAQEGRRGRQRDERRDGRALARGILTRMPRSRLLPVDASVERRLATCRNHSHLP